MSNRNAITLEMENKKERKLTIGTFDDGRETDQTVDIRSEVGEFSGEATPAVNVCV